MSDTVAEPDGSVKHADDDDERLSYRGVFQQILVRPEIGAMAGAIGIWVFFWAVSVTLGTANGASNILDSSTNLGIMAVAVSMLMIGGEFDLSSGANTGAMGILIILLVKETGDLGGAGLSLWIAIPISFLVAMGIGYFNGWMVEKTALPSFIITLATFFVLKGLKLGLTKRLIDQIQAGRTDEGHGYAFWRKVFASEWTRTDHQLAARDWIYTISIVLGIVLILVSVYELYFLHRSDPQSIGLVQLVVGAAGGIFGAILMHGTDGVGANWGVGLLIGASTLIGLHGLAVWRYQPLEDPGDLRMERRVSRPLAYGVGGVALGVFFAIILDADDASDLIFPFTEQGMRATLFIGLVGAGFTFLFIAASRAKRVNMTTKTAVSVLTAVLLAALAFFARSQSDVEKFRSEAFSVMLFASLLLFAWAMLGYRFEERRFSDPVLERKAGRMVLYGTLLLILGSMVKLLFTTDDEIAAGIPTAKFSMRIVWFLAFTAVMTWVLGKTKFGSWTFAVGGNKEASRQVGVPAARTKTQLFMLVSGAAWLVGMLIAFRINSIQANQGDGEEFEFIIAAVVGGTLLTGGYGTALGAAIGALIMSMATLGIPNSRWNSDWRFLFLGVILLLAVIANRFIRTKAESMR